METPSEPRGAMLQNRSSLTEELMQLIQVLYRNNRGGPVDDITLDELIRLRKVTHFYRPSEERWVDIFVDPVRGRDHRHHAEGSKRRFIDREEDDEQKAGEEESDGFFRRVRMRFKKHPPRKALSAEGWLKRGFQIRLNTDDHVGAARAFALAIRLSSQYQEAYLHRGLVYEELGNFQQAIEDYRVAVTLDPKDGKTHNPRGRLLGRPDVTVKAIAGLRRAADLQRASSHMLLASPKELREAFEAFAGRNGRGKGSAAAGEEFPETPEDLQRLIEAYRKEIMQLETQLQRVKHKRDILLEASRLLEEEEPTPSQGSTRVSKAQIHS